MKFHSRFIRRKKRTPKDVFNNAITPKLKMKMQQSVQEVATYARKHHNYANRTGALEDSVQWSPPKRVRKGYEASVHAGGWGKVQWSNDHAYFMQTGKQRKNVRYQRGRRFHPRRGQGILAYYAAFVEAKGFPVLKHAVKKFKRKITRRFKNELKIRKL